MLVVNDAAETDRLSERIRRKLVETRGSNGSTADHGHSASRLPADKRTICTSTGTLPAETCYV